MYADLTQLRAALLADHTTQQLTAARQRLGWYTRKVIDQVTATDRDIAEGLRRLLGERAGPSKARLAVGALLVHAAFDLLAVALRAPEAVAGRAYDVYFREDQPTGVTEFPLTLAGAIARAQGEGEGTLLNLVVTEAAARLGLPRPAPRLVREARRHLMAFALIGHEAVQLLRERRPAGLMSAAEDPRAGPPRPLAYYEYTPVPSPVS